MPLPDPGLIDILPPPAPPPGPVVLLVLLLGLLLATAVLIYLLRRHLSRKARCRRALSRLQHRPAETSAATARGRGFYIAALLRFALGYHHLDPDHALPARLASRQGDWQAFLSRLMRACYAPQPPSATTLTRLCAEARDWIRQWP